MIMGEWNWGFICGVSCEAFFSVVVGVAWGIVREFQKRP